MGLTPSPEDLTRALDDAGEVTFVRWRHLQRSQGVMTFLWKGKTMQFVTKGEVVRHALRLYLKL